MNVKKLIPFAIFTAVAFSAPLFTVNPYDMMIMTVAGLNAIVTVGMCLLIGYAGQISLGHAAFFALGGYTTSILTTRFGMPVYVGFMAAIAISVAIAFIIGIPTLRLRGHYLGMATLGFGVIVYHIIESNISLTGGSAGLPGVPPLVLFGLDMNSGDGLLFYYLVWGIVAAEVLFAFNIIRSRPGRALMSIHGNEEAAEAMGVDTSGFKLRIFVMSAAMASLSGFLYAHRSNFIGVDSAEMLKSVLFVEMVAVGGMANIWGTIAATVFLSVLPEFLRFFKELDILIYGLIIVVIMIFLPEGIFVGLYNLIRKMASARRNKATKSKGGK